MEIARASPSLVKLGLVPAERCLKERGRAPGDWLAQRLQSGQPLRAVRSAGMGARPRLRAPPPPGNFLVLWLLGRSEDD